MFTTYLEKWKQIPKSVKFFLFKALALLFIWKTIYLVFLLPTRVLDAPSTYSVGVATAYSLNLLYNTNNYSSKKEIALVNSEFGPVHVNQQAIYLNDKKVVAIEDACNGLELFILYAGFIICLPAFWLRKVAFISIGLVLIYLINIFRCTLITWVLLNHANLFGFVHHYLFTFIVYVFIIVLWLLFTRKLTPNYATEQ